MVAVVFDHTRDYDGATGSHAATLGEAIGWAFGRGGPLVRGLPRGVPIGPEIRRDRARPTPPSERSSPPPDGLRRRVVPTTEDPGFAEAPSPPTMKRDGPTKAVRFAGPAAVILKAA